VRQAHHEEFEKRVGFQQCITALKDYYDEFVVPVHVVRLKAIFGQLP
jgi:hypothetical protein